MFHLVNKEGSCYRSAKNKHKRDELVRLGYQEVPEKKAKELVKKTAKKPADGEGAAE